jgi:hypothetical protein
MQPMRTEHDSLHKASSNKLDEVSLMKRECAYARKSLRKYLLGHLFKLQKIRIERHLKSCAVCSSEYQALKQENETRQILKNIAPPEGLVQQLKESVSGLAKLKKLFYRPLWIAVILGVIVLVYINAVAPRHGDVEIENIEKSLPPATPPAAVTPTPTAAPAPAQPTPVVPSPVAQPAAPKPAAKAPAVAPLTITITPADDSEAIQRVNEVMRGHGSLRKLKFSDTVREISGRLTGKELLTFLSQIESAGKVTYSRRKSELVSSAQPIPIVLRLKPAPKTAGRPTTETAPTVYQPAETSAQPASAPTQSALP